MNAIQKWILYGAAAILVLSCLCPPVGADFLVNGGYIHNFNGWKWIWHTGGGGSEKIQIRLLLAEWGAILVLAGLLVLANKTK
jgi:hypothetical protein